MAAGPLALSGLGAVEAVEVRAFTVPADQPEADGTFAWDSTTLVLVEATADGATGVGWTYAPAACADLVRDLLVPLVDRTPVDDVPRAWRSMVDGVRNVARAGVASTAISAVDLALWDLRARLLGLPLHRLLGPLHDAVPAYGSGGFTTYDVARLDRQLQEWLEAGLQHVKIKIGEDRGRCVARDLARTRQVRGVVGEGVGVMIDANGGYREQQAREVGHALADL